MGDPQDSTEILLQKARDRRARNAEATFQKRERTGPEKLCKLFMAITFVPFYLLRVLRPLWEPYNFMILIVIVKELEKCFK